MSQILKENVPFRARRQSSPDKPESIGCPSSRSIPPSSSSSASPVPRYVAHLNIGFSLVKYFWIRTPTNPEFAQLRALFPGTWAVEINAPYLVIRVHSLPTKPWPVTVAGVPLYLTTDKQDRGFELGKFVLGPHILTDYDAQTTGASTAMFKHTQDYLTSQKIKVTGIFFIFGACWVIHVKSKTELDSQLGKLPRTIANTTVQYKLDSEAQVRSLASRMQNPTDDSPDSTDYAKRLRPGCLIIARNPENYKTSIPSYTGVAVIKNGQEYVTIATHACEYQETTMHHPFVSSKRDDCLVGKIELILGGTDVSLMKLEQGWSFTNEPFTEPNNITQSIKGIQQFASIRAYDPVTLESAYTGRIYGSVTGLGQVVEGETGDWVKFKMIYFGNHAAGPTDEVCGSPVLTDDVDAEVVGFYRYYDQSEKAAACLAASELRDVYDIQVCQKTISGH